MKLAVITGASSGIGKATARLLAADGYTVVLVARNRQALDRVAQEIGSQAIVEACDASDGDAVLAMAERVRRDHGVPHVIVNSAGAGQWKRIEDTTPAEAVTMMGAPYFAAFNVTHAFMREMLAEGRGVIVHVGSPASICTWPSSTGYAASRWALRGLHESLCDDLRGTGVRSCHVLFGRVSSPYFEHNPDTATQATGDLPADAPALRVELRRLPLAHALAAAYHRGQALRRRLASRERVVCPVAVTRHPILGSFRPLVVLLLLDRCSDLSSS
jgi:NAD(P)-dependent dehydrogenase (short-subunit alcohol dehydrogenase family)